MTQYTDRNGKELSEISNNGEWWAYFEQVREELQNRRRATFLPLAPDIENIRGFQGIRFDIGYDGFVSSSKTEDIDTLIMNQTLSLTIDKHINNSEFCSRIITEFANLRPENTEKYSKTDRIYSGILANIISSYSGYGRYGWLKSLSPSAQMSAFAVIMDNNMPVGNADNFKIDFNNLSDAEKFNLQACAGYLLKKYSLNPHDRDRLSWETKAQLLQTLFATNAYDIPTAETYINLLRSINPDRGDVAERIAALTEITKVVYKNYKRLSCR